MDTPGGPALVWYIVFDDPAAAARFERQAGKLSATDRAGYLARFEPVTLDGKPGARYVLAPVTWTGWTALPAAHVAPAP